MFFSAKKGIEPLGTPLFEEGEKPLNFKNKIIKYNGHKIKGNGEKMAQRYWVKTMITIAAFPVISFCVLSLAMCADLFFSSGKISLTGGFVALSSCYVAYRAVRFAIYFLKKQRCTELITATASYIAKEKVYVREKVSARHGGGMAAPTLKRVWVAYYKYFCGGLQYFSHCVAYPEEREKPSLGDSYKILVNPDKPEEYMDNDPYYALKFWLYTAFVVFIVGMTIYAFNTNMSALVASQAEHNLTRVFR